MAKLRASDATLSSTYSWARWPASHTIDGDLSTICASRWQAGAWLSIALPAGSTIDYVAVYNRADFRAYADWLNPFEVWVGSAAGDTASSSAVKCAGAVSAPWSSNGVVAPFVIACPRAVGSYVTLKLIGRARYLTLIQLEAYTTTRLAAATSPAFTKRTAEGGEGGSGATADAGATEPLPVSPDSGYYVGAPSDGPAGGDASSPTSLGLASVLGAMLALSLLAVGALIVRTRRLQRRLKRTVTWDPAIHSNI